jgi:ABC-type molybdate transport system permease subunit
MPNKNLIEWVFKQPIMFTWWADISASTIVAFPLLYQSSLTGFEAIDRDIEYSARVDGASNLYNGIVRGSTYLRLNLQYTKSNISTAMTLESLLLDKL